MTQSPLPARHHNSILAGVYEFPCDPCDTCTGDTNGDGNIDALDIEGFINCLFP